MMDKETKAKVIASIEKKIIRKQQKRADLDSEIEIYKKDLVKTKKIKVNE